MACGEMGLAPREFYALTYGELMLLLKGNRDRIRRERKARHDEAAWMVTWLLTPHSSDMEKLVEMVTGRKPRRAPRFASPAAAADAFFAAYNAKSKRGDSIHGE